MKLRLALAAALFALAAPAAAHIVFDAPQAAAGSYHAGFLRVSHGCGPSATVALRVEIPAGIVVAKPQPKPGWTLRIETAPLATPIQGEGGMIRERVAAIIWTGRLPTDEFEQFGLMLKLPPNVAGPLYFPTTQRCETGETAWTMIPPAGQPWGSVPHPAPVLTVTAADAMEHMHH